MDFSIRQTEQALMRFLAELKIKLEKLELKIVKLEKTIGSSSSTRHDEKNIFFLEVSEFMFLGSI